MTDVLALDGWEMVLRVLLAVALGAAVGIDREIDAQPAGFRTHVLVCLGAALFGLISVHAFDPFITGRNRTNVNVDITRVASNVVVGIGFLGGGAILKYGATVRGLTTAASMWVTAAIGLAVGVGYYWAAVVVTGATLGALVGFRYVRSWIRRHFARESELVTFQLRRGAVPGDLVTALHELPGVSVRSLRIETADDVSEVTVGLKTEPGVRLDARIAPLASRADVAEFSLEER
ncbi:MAG TPA: MgtC/SapB family protein [Acidimicrobiia bacterium]